MSKLILLFLYSSSVYAKPYSCEQELLINQWPRDCLIYLELKTDLDEDLYHKVQNWCEQNSKSTLEPRSYNGFDIKNSKLPKPCTELIKSSRHFHKFRELHIF